MSRFSSATSSVLAAVLAPLVIAGCGGGDDEASEAPRTHERVATATPTGADADAAATTSSATVAPSADTTEASPTTEPAQPTASSTAAATTPDAEPPVPGAYPGAGGPVPAGARPATHVDAGLDAALIVTPSGKIGCVLGGEQSACGVEGLLRDPAPYPGPNGDPQWWIPLSGDGPPEIMPKGDPPAYLTSPAGAQTVPYGSVVQHKEFVCASEEDGLTCWNTSTGHGAFMNRDGYWPF